MDGWMENLLPAPLPRNISVGLEKGVAVVEILFPDWEEGWYH